MDEVMEEHKHHIEAMVHQKMMKRAKVLEAVDMEKEEATLEKKKYKWNDIIATNMAIMPGSVVVQPVM